VAIQQRLLLRTDEPRLMQAWKEQKNEVDVAPLYEESLRRYLEHVRSTTQRLPRRASSKLNLRAIARACGFGRHVFCGVSSVTKLLDDFDKAEREEGIAIVAPNVALRQYLDSLKAAGIALPLYNGQPNKRAVARACGFALHHFGCDPRLLEMLTAFVKET
jgi:hypothetical protein